MGKGKRDQVILDRQCHAQDINSEQLFHCLQSKGIGASSGPSPWLGVDMEQAHMNVGRPVSLLPRHSKLMQ